MSKKIIFIAGTSYSGSTLIDLILSNSSNATSVGEIEAIFNPVKIHHLNKIKEIKSDPVWGDLLDKGVKKLYQNLHDILDVEIIVDSSKNPAWIRYHIDRLPKDVSYEVILVYKSLPDLKHSYEKRGRYNWVKIYKRYHNLFFNTISDFNRIEYKDIPLISDKFLALLKGLDIELDEERLEFWNQSRTNFFGNNNANIAFNQAQGIDEKPKLEYKSGSTPENIAYVNSQLEKDVELRQIATFLNSEESCLSRPKSTGIMNNFRFRILVKQLRVIRFKIKKHFR
jgi:hypothetical protein